LLAPAPTITAAAGADPTRPSAIPTFDTFIQSRIAALPPIEDELPWYSNDADSSNGADLTQVSVGDLRRYRDLGQRFGSPAHHVLYADWLPTESHWRWYTRVAHRRLDWEFAYGGAAVRLRATWFLTEYRVRGQRGQRSDTALARTVAPTSARRGIGNAPESTR